MADKHEEHHEPIHQAPWVPVLTLAVCFGFAALVIGVKLLAGG